MTLVRFEPFRGLDSVLRRFDELFEDMVRSFPARFEIGSFAPRVDVVEDEHNVYIHAELPGVRKEDVKVSISEDRVLTIQGEKKQEQKEEGRNFLRMERFFGSFCRSFMLPENVKIDDVEAKFEDGVLTVTLPKTAPSKPKEVEVKVR
ncbi:MAG: Hsp20/alpha crystallin family protein [Candidatus Kapabacteria bacterium]|nr:Hsp20/alpha crystallin family protein [Candidatus Kapabacteria bacterium]MCS7169352.1 Hsp20/alpha crystallin family protein [Candidatus Kapabacteria bacterium]MDW8224789.1 Hsp20/alpha crystallin family protein [Bacteroidota bacterium]